MWVRSQGGHTLINVEVFQIYDDKISREWYIKAINTSCERVLGKYKKEATAKKVLDKIQRVCANATGVFQMPPDEESEKAKVAISYD